MSTLVPSRVLFRYAFPVGYAANMPKAGGRLGLGPEYRLPDLSGMDGAKSFGDLRLAWNESGLGIQLEVTGKRSSPRPAGSNPAAGDGLQVWLDTRNTQNIHRAGRYCHRFFLGPVGRGPRLLSPTARLISIPRAREEPPQDAADGVALVSEITSKGYTLDAWFPVRTLQGFDPVAFPKLGFYFALHDQEHGTRTLTVGEEFPYDADPSLWSTLDLVRG
jgi:hypothetical protein